MARRLEMLGPQEEVCLGCSRQRAPSVLKSYTESQSGQASVATAHLALQRSDEPAPSQTHHLRNRQALKQSGELSCPVTLADANREKTSFFPGNNSTNEKPQILFL